MQALGNFNRYKFVLSFQGSAILDLRFWENSEKKLQKKKKKKDLCNVRQFMSSKLKFVMELLKEVLK